MVREGEEEAMMCGKGGGGGSHDVRWRQSNVTQTSMDELALP